MKATTFALFVGLLMVGCGESSQPSEGADMTDTAPESPSPSESVDTTDTARRKDAVETAVDWSKLEIRNGIRYLQNTETSFTGRAVEFYENGQRKRESNYKDGKPHGLLTHWHANGQKEWEANNKNGKKDGLTIHWDENGQKKWEGNWKDGKRDGLQVFYMDDGRVGRTTYKDGEIVD